MAPNIRLSVAARVSQNERAEYSASSREKNMSMRALGSAVVVSAFLLGCAAMDHQGGGGSRTVHVRDQVCPGSSAVCMIDVNVTCSSGTCTASIDPKVLLIDHGHPNEKIMWTLNGQGFEFPADGIVFSSGFSCQSQGPRGFKCTNANYVANSIYPYTVKVTNVANPGSPVTIDPWIVNN